MPKNTCFCVYDCAGKDVTQTDSNYTKMIKNEHETGKVKQGQSSGFLKSKKSSKHPKKSSKFDKLARLALGESFKKYHVWPSKFQDVT